MSKELSDTSSYMRHREPILCHTNCNALFTERLSGFPQPCKIKGPRRKTENTQLADFINPVYTIIVVVITTPTAEQRDFLVRLD